MSFSAPSANFYSRYYLAIIILVLLGGVSATAYTYIKITSLTQESLLRNVNAVANTLEPHHIVTLSGSEADLTHPDYIILKKRIQKIKEISGNRYVYVTGYREELPFFFADSESEDSLGYAAPGTAYTSASQTFHNVFSDRRPIVENVFSAGNDVWLSAVAPIIDHETNHVVAVLGMDLSARQYYRTIYAYSMVPAIATFFLTILLAIGYAIRKREQQFLAFKSELVSIASHEIRTPLTGILWVADGLLEKGGGLSDEQKNDIQMIKHHSKNLILIINDFLDLSAVEKIKIKKLIRKEFFTRPFLEKIAENFQIVLMEKSLQLIFDSSVTFDLKTVGDEDRLKRMFNNLISNAIKYSKPGGNITIGYAARDKSVVYWIKDQGIGIPEKDRSKIFDGFYRADNAKQAVESGTGLGLRYVKQVAELHGGRVWYESKENGGTTFFVELRK